jgi:hypothetical protein
MAKSIRGIKKKRGRPRTTGSGVQIGVRWQVADLTAIDEWRGKHEDPLSRADAIRHLVKQALAHSSDIKPKTKQKAQKASELAGRAVDRVVDKSMPMEEQERRKRAVIKGPKEFRDIREDQPPKPK